MVTYRKREKIRWRRQGLFFGLWNCLNILHNCKTIKFQKKKFLQKKNAHSVDDTTIQRGTFPSNILISC